MYISEVIREADALNPNEYTLNEKYAWIDELNATLMQEHLNKYASVELEPMEDGTYLLPEGITFEMVDKIIAQGRSIEKYDFRSFGITPLYTPRERFFVPVHCQAKGAITVIYLAQAEPIREGIRITWFNTPKLTLNFCTTNSIFVKTDDMYVFRAGDIVNVKMTYSDSQSAEYEELPVLDVISEEKDGSEGIKLVFKDGTFRDAAVAEYTIDRLVTEQTLVPAPYDRMYIDWIIAKIMFYQKNYTAYNQNMNKFYNTLQQFDNWYIQRAPADKDNKIRNWFK